MTAVRHRPYVRQAHEKGKWQKEKRLSPCHDQPLIRRKLWSKCWVCKQCGNACGSSKYEQLQIDMK